MQVSSILKGPLGTKERRLGSLQLGWKWGDGAAAQEPGSGRPCPCPEEGQRLLLSFSKPLPRALVSLDRDSAGPRRPASWLDNGITKDGGGVRKAWGQEYRGSFIQAADVIGT